jgi:hypothetical protein
MSHEENILQEQSFFLRMIINLRKYVVVAEIHLRKNVTGAEKGNLLLEKSFI